MDKTYCIFGDSITQAAYVKIGWVELFRQYLEDKHQNDFVNVFNLGVGGNTVEDILKRFESESSLRNPNFILFAVGINDTKYDNLAQFRKNLSKLIELAKIFTSEIIFVGLVLGDWKGEDSFSKERTKYYNRTIKEVAELNGCEFVQLQEILKPEDFMDGLHPNEQGHKKIFGEVSKYF